jgi:hypothetical protein
MVLSGKMEANEEHMFNADAAVKKMDSTVLDCFTALTDTNEGLRVEAGVKLLEHVFRKQVKFQVSGKWDRAYDGFFFCRLPFNYLSH